MSQTPLLVSPSLQQIGLGVLQRFAFEESRHRLLCEEPELRSLQPHYRSRVEYSRRAKGTLLLTFDPTPIVLNARLDQLA